MDALVDLSAVMGVFILELEGFIEIFPLNLPLKSLSQEEVTGETRDEHIWQKKSHARIDGRC